MEINNQFASLRDIEQIPLATQFIPVRGLEEKILEKEHNNGYVYFATDTGKIYIDTPEENKKLMGGSSGIFYARHIHIDTPTPEQEDFEFYLSELDDTDRVPQKDDLILNIPDGCFYRVDSVEYFEDNTIIYVKRMTLAGGGGGGPAVSGGTSKINWKTTSPTTALFGKKFQIKFEAMAVDADNNPTEGGEYVVKADRTAGVPQTIIMRGPVNQGSNEIEIGKYLNETGDWKVRVEINMDIGGNAPQTWTKTFTVSVTTVSLTWEYKQEQINNISNIFTIKDWKFIGDGLNKQLNILIDDYISVNPVNLENLSSLDITINPKDEKYQLTHGVHKFEMWGTVLINGESVSTEHIYHNVIFVEDGNGTTLISHELFNTNLQQYTTVKIPIVIYSPKNTEEGSVEIILFEDSIQKTSLTNCKNGQVYELNYTPSRYGDNIPLIIKCDNEEVSIIINVEKLNIDNEEVSGYKLKFKSSEMMSDEDIINWIKNGGHQLSENFDWVNGGLKTEEYEEYVDGERVKRYRQYFLIKNGNFITLNYKPFSNEDMTKNGLSLKIIYKAINCRDYDAQFLSCYDEQQVVRYDESQEIDLAIPEGTNIKYSGMAVADGDDISLSNSQFVTISYDVELSTESLDALNNKYIEYDNKIYHFGYRLDPNENNKLVITINPTYSVVLGTGIKMRAQETEFSCISSSLTVPYYEESYIELEFDIAKSEKDNNQYKKRYIKPWLDGVPCGIALYDSSDNIKQNNPKNIVIGSNDCDVCLYMFKVYEKSLTDEEHLENFIADAPNAEEMKRRYDRNDILDKALSERYATPIIDYVKLSEKNPNCHVHVYSIERMTTNKKTPVGVYNYMQYLNGEKILSTKPSQVEEKSHQTPLNDSDRNKCPAQMKVQGTSSASYGLSAFNIDTDFTWLNGESSLLGPTGEELPNGWQMDEDAYPCTFFCTKVNVASCEGANNALNQEWYNAHQPYISAARRLNYDEKGNLKPGPKYRDTMQFQPGIVFIRDWNPTTDSDIGTNNNLFKEVSGYTDSPFYNFYSIGQMGNSKDNVHVFHTQNECCIENKDNQLPGQWMTICPGSYTTTIDGVERTYYVDLDSLDGETEIKEIGQSISNRALWKNSLDSIYEFRYPDGIENASDEMIEGWFRFVHWMSRNDPMPRYEAVKIFKEEEFNKLKEKYLTVYKKIDLPDDDIDYIPIEQFDSNISEYYYETIHIHGPTGKKLQDGVKKTYGNYTFKDEQHSKNLIGITVTDYAQTYKYDTQDYRMAKMLDKCEEYLVMDSVVYHYLFIERHTMVDNVAKNTFWSSSDYMHWDLTKDYDNDTADGNDNQGKLTLTYGLEVGDTINDVSVFNAGSSVWLNFIRLLPSIRKSLYQTLNTNGTWDSDKYLNRFNEWQNALPERCYIYDYWRKYLRPWEVYNDRGFLPRLEGGKKTHQRKQYEKYQGNYLDSKYQTKLDNSLAFRPNSDYVSKFSLSLELYADGYINVSLGGVLQSIRAKRNAPYQWAGGGNTFTDATLYFYNPENIQSIGNELIPNDSLAFSKTKTFDGASLATKLRKLVFSTQNDEPHTGQLETSFGTLKMLEYLYACNLTFNDTNQSLNLADCSNIKHVDTYGSNFSVITIANNAPLEYLRLDSPSILNFTNLRKLNTFDSFYNSIQSLNIDNIDESKINSKDIVNSSFDSNIFNSYTLNNIQWNIDNGSEIDTDNNGIIILDRLIDKYKDNKEKLPNSLTGKIIVDADAYNKNTSIDLYHKYSRNDVYPKVDIQFLGEEAKLYNVEVVNGQGAVIWNRKIVPNASISNTFFMGDENYTPSFGRLEVDQITKDSTTDTIYTKTGTWNIYNADTGALLDGEVRSDENGYPIYTGLINSNIRIEHYFAESVRYYTVVLYDGDNKTKLLELTGSSGRVTYKTPLVNILNDMDTIPYRDDSKLGLKETYSYSGYHYIQNSSNALPTSYQIVSDCELYPVFDLIPDITKLTPKYDYFTIQQNNTTNYTENLADENLSDQELRYVGYGVSPKIRLRGKVVLPLLTKDNEIITSYYGFSEQKDITHIFFENKKIEHLFCLKYLNNKGCFQNCTNLVYFDFHDNLGNIGQYSFAGSSINIDLYDNVIYLGKNLRIIEQLAFNNAFQSSKSSIICISPETLSLNSQCISANDRLMKDSIIYIGEPQEPSKLILVDPEPEHNTQWFGCIQSNSKSYFGKINFYTNNYTKENDIALIRKVFASSASVGTMEERILVISVSI